MQTKYKPPLPWDVLEWFLGKMLSRKDKFTAKEHIHKHKVRKLKIIKKHCSHSQEGVNSNTIYESTEQSQKIDLKSYRKITRIHWLMHSISIDVFLGKGKRVCLITRMLWKSFLQKKNTCRTFEKVLLAQGFLLRIFSLSKKCCDFSMGMLS